MINTQLNTLLNAPGGYLSRHLLSLDSGADIVDSDNIKHQGTSYAPVHIPHPKNPMIHAYDTHATMHRHPRDHSFEGLPTSFWASFIFFLVIFHLFLAKLIYNEFFNRNSHMIPAVNYERLRTLRYTV